METNQPEEMLGLLNRAQNYYKGLTLESIISLLVKIGIAIGLVAAGIIIGWFIWGKKEKTPQNIPYAPLEILTSTPAFSSNNHPTETLTNTTYIYNFNDTECEVCNNNKSYCISLLCANPAKLNGIWKSKQPSSVIRWINATTFRAEMSFNARIRVEAEQSQIVNASAGMVISKNGKRYVFGIFRNRPLDSTSRTCSRTNSAQRINVNGQKVVKPNFVCEFDFHLDQGDKVTINLVGEHVFKFFINVYPLNDENIEQHANQLSNYVVRSIGDGLDQSDDTNDKILIEMVKSRINQEKNEDEKLTFARSKFGEVPMKGLLKNLQKF